MNFTILREFFASFLRIHRIARHFRRFTLLDTLTQPGISRELPKGLTQALINAALIDPQELLRQLDSHDDGLTEVQAEAVRARVRLNEIDYEKPLPW
jgi:Mg2+-importing ATPase